MSNSGVYTESQTEASIWTTGVDCLNSVNNGRVRVLNYKAYLLLGLNPYPPDDFCSETPSFQTPYPLCYVHLPDNSEGMFSTYKPNVSICFFKKLP